jgi:DNA polymerase III delta prime subunit
MNPDNNPFNPGPGAFPPLLVGRESILEEIKIYLRRAQNGTIGAPFILTGLRGVGKTVILIELSKIASEMGMVSSRIEVDEKKDYNFQLAIFEQLRESLFKLDTLKNLLNQSSRVLSVFKNVSIKLGKLADFSLDIEIEPIYGSGDSGSFSLNLLAMMRELGELAKKKNKVICIFIDEFQNLSRDDMSALLGSMHRMVQDSLPLIIIGAGLPSLRAKAGDAKAYAERFNIINIGPLPDSEARKAIISPLELRGVSIEEEGLQSILDKADGYPYFLQQFANLTWDMADKSPITYEVVKKAIPRALAILDERFFLTRYEQTTPTERDFMNCMASQLKPPYAIADINRCLNKDGTQTSPVRANLITKGFIYDYRYGQLDFTVPLFADFLRRQSA